MIINEYYLYWIHKQGDTCIGKDGYVGISCDPRKRIKTHFRNAFSLDSQLPVYRSMRKYENSLVVKIIACGDRGTISELERMLRPSPKIGWNLSVGGDTTTIGLKLSPEHIQKIVSKNTGRKNSPETRKKMSDAMKGIKKSPEHCKKIGDLKRGKPLSDATKLKISLANKGRPAPRAEQFIEYRKQVKPWEESRVKGDCVYYWSIADKLHNHYVKTGNKAWASETYFGVKIGKFKSIFKHFKKGWIPHEDQDWLAFRDKYNSENTA